MTEQEYCDLSDLQLCRAMLGMARSMNCFDDPNKARLELILVTLRMLTADLEPKILTAMNKDA